MTDKVDAFRHWVLTHNRDNYGRYDAFAAGAAWQREQDAKLMENTFHKVGRRPSYDPKGPGEMYSPFAEVIRAQGSKQDTPAPKPCQHECWESSPGKPDACARCGYVVTNQESEPK